MGIDRGALYPRDVPAMIRRRRSLSPRMRDLTLDYGCAYPASRRPGLLLRTRELLWRNVIRREIRSRLADGAAYWPFRAT